MIVQAIHDILSKILNFGQNTIGLFTPFESVTFKKNTTRFPVARKIYAALLIIILIALFVQMQHSQISLFATTRTSNMVLLIITQTSLTGSAIYNILNHNFLMVDSWNQFFKVQSLVKSKLRVNIARKPNCFIFEFCIGHIPLAVGYLLNYIKYYATHKNADILICLIVGVVDVLYYYMFIATAIIYHAALHLGNDLQSVKIDLTNALNIYDNPNFHLKYTDENFVSYQTPIIDNKSLIKILEISKILNLIFELMHIFNLLFGKTILVISFLTVIVTLACLNTLLIGVEMKTLTMDTAGSNVTEAVIFMAWNALIISRCSRLHKECASIVHLTCKLQHLLPKSSQERKELLNLAHQVANSAPTITAAGFFNVDLPLVLSIFTCVGTYIVVLIQFSYMDF